MTTSLVAELMTVSVMMLSPIVKVLFRRAAASGLIRLRSEAFGLHHTFKQLAVERRFQSSRGLFR